MAYGKLTNDDYSRIDKAICKELSKPKKNLMYFTSPEGEKQFHKAVKEFYNNNFKKDDK